MSLTTCPDASCATDEYISGFPVREAPILPKDSLVLTVRMGGSVFASRLPLAQSAIAYYSYYASVYAIYWRDANP